MSYKPDISVIVPVYKQEKTVVGIMTRLKDSLNQIHQSYEIICVIDGMLDKSFQTLKKARLKNVSVVAYQQNRGKGHAVRFGMAKARGNIVGFVDCGRDLDYSVIPLLFEHLKWYQADVILASKRHPASQVTYPWQRRILSWGYQFLVKILFGLNIKDTQVGIKFFKKEVIEKVLPRLLIKQYAFDIEMLAVANYLGYTKIYEAPVRLKMDFSGSTIATQGFVTTVLSMLQDTLAVFYRLKILHYYDDSNKKNWHPNMYLEW